MNLRSLNNLVAGIGTNAPAAAGFFRQIRRDGVLSPRPMTSIASTRAKFLTTFLGLALLPIFAAEVLAQTNYYNPNGTEYAVVGALPGDQIFPDAAVSTTGGFVVWQDNITDGDGWGISARQLNSTLSGNFGTFRVNSNGAGNQENPRVALLKNGGAVFVWQGGSEGFQHIYARFLNASNTFTTTSDVMVNATTNYFQIAPEVCVLNNSNVVVVWSSYDEAASNSMQDVYGQILSPSGVKIGGEFLINQFTTFNQRSPAVAALPNGGFITTWVSEQERILAASLGTNTTYASASSLVTPSVDIYARVYNASGTATGGEFIVNTDSNPCANPVVAVATDGSCLVAWCARDMVNLNNSLDIHGRTFTSGGTGGNVFTINAHLYGDQYLPRIASLGLDYLVSWTSMGQDGSREGVYAQFVHEDGSFTGGEFRVNTTTLSQQKEQTVASDGANQFLVVWTSFTGLPNGFDLYAQRYINASATLQAMPAPYVWAPFVLSNNVYQPQLVVTWAPLLGLAVSNYEIYVNGATTPTALVTSNEWIMTAAYGLSVSSTQSFQLDYVTADGRRSPISPSASGHTWEGYSWYGIPFEWMVQNYGGNVGAWPLATSKPSGSKLTLLQIYLSGGIPSDPTTWLTQSLVRTSQGLFLSWNTQAGATYQVQSTTNFSTWNNVGSPRFAAGTSDAIYVGGSPVGYYQVLLMR